MMALAMHKHNYFLLLALLSLIINVGFTSDDKKDERQPVDYVTIAILAKDKAHTLPLYLACLEQQTWPVEKTYLYIRTNNNSDNTADILRSWKDKVSNSYAGIYFDDTDVDAPIQNYKQHEWNSVRFKILGKIRQDSVSWARDHQSHYFVVDCDNFIVPETLQTLVETNLPIVAPLIKVKEPLLYANYHEKIDRNGYYLDSPLYLDILSRKVRGLIELPLVHCTYFVRNNVLDKIYYDDNSSRYEYVIFSDSARKQNIAQYIDNRKLYGRITFAENTEDFKKEPWLYEFDDVKEKAHSIFTNIYKQGIWAKNNEGKGSSGEGSTAENTVVYRAYLEDFLKNNNIQSVVDAGCGDWEFSRLIPWQGINYKGYDIVEHIIENNNKVYSTPSIQFHNGNFIKNSLPKADLLICKDVLQHIPNEDVAAFIAQIGKFKHCLITNDINPSTNTSDNTDIEMGGYRPVDLTKPPFNLKGERVLIFNSGRVKKQVLYIENIDYDPPAQS